MPTFRHTPAAASKRKKSIMRKLLDGLYLATGWLAALCVLVICVLMIGQSILREFGVRTGATNDVVAWLCAAAAFLAMAHAFKHGDFVRVTLLLENVPPGVRRCWSSYRWPSPASPSATWRFGQPGSAGKATSSTTWPTACSPFRCGSRRRRFVVGAWLFFIAVLDEMVLVLRVAPAPPTSPPSKSAMRTAISRPMSDQRP